MRVVVAVVGGTSLTWLFIFSSGYFVSSKTQPSFINSLLCGVPLLLLVNNVYSTDL